MTDRIEPLIDSLDELRDDIIDRARDVLANEPFGEWSHPVATGLLTAAQMVGRFRAE